MLWRKAWLESQARFFIGAITLVGLCMLFVVFQTMPRSEGTLTYSAYIWRTVYRGYIREIFVLLVLLLGLGGLLIERENGTATFTLALPVSRFRLTGVRAGVGLFQVILLASIPAVLIPALSGFVHQSYPPAQSLYFFSLWTFSGAVLLVT